jgi:hypothetical protein
MRSRAVHGMTMGRIRRSGGGKREGAGFIGDPSVIARRSTVEG